MKLDFAFVKKHALAVGAAAAGAVGLTYALWPAKAAAAPIAPTQPKSYQMVQGHYFGFDITTQAAWNDPTGAVAQAVGAALTQAGFQNIVAEPDPSDLYRWAVTALWPAGASATTVTDNPPTWMIDDTTINDLGTAQPAQPTSYQLNPNDWYSLILRTSFGQSTPHSTEYVQTILANVGFDQSAMTITPNAQDPMVWNVQAKFVATYGASVTDGPPIWIIIPSPQDLGSTQPAP